MLNYNRIIEECVVAIKAAKARRNVTH
jgi:hypothetical protein